MSKTTSASKRRTDGPVRIAAPRTAQTIMLALIVMTLAVVLPLALFGPGSGEAARRFAAGSLAALGLYSFLAASIAACMVPRLRGVPRRVSVDPRPRLRREPHTVVVPVAFDPIAAEKLLRAAGYRHIAADERSAWGVKNRWSPLGTVVLHAALILGIVAAGLAAAPGIERMAHVSALPGEAVGEDIGISGLRLSDFSATEGPDGTIAGISATLVTEGGRDVRLRPDLPALVGPAQAVTIEDYDHAVTFSVEPTSGRVPVYEKTAKLRLRGDRSHDIVTIDAEELGLYRIMVRHVDQAGASVAATVERFEAGEWRLVGPESLYRRGESVAVEGSRVRFQGVRPYALLRVHESPTAPVVALSMLAAVVGAAMRLVFPRREATVAAIDSGSAVTVVVDVFKGSRNESSRLALALGEVS